MNIVDKNIGDHVSLITYDSVEFYKPKSIYLNKVNVFDNTQLYSDTSLSSYIKSEWLT